MPASKSHTDDPGTIPFWTSALWILEVVTPASRERSTRFAGAHGHPTLLARKLAARLLTLEDAADGPNGPEFAAERTTFPQAVLWWVHTSRVMPAAFENSFYPENVLLWFGTALRERFGGRNAIHANLRGIAERRASWRDDLVRERDLLDAEVRNALQGG